MTQLLVRCLGCLFGLELLLVSFRRRIKKIPLFLRHIVRILLSFQDLHNGHLLGLLLGLLNPLLHRLVQRV